MRASHVELTQLVRDAIKELDFKEEPHPQLRPGEVFIGQVELTADRSGKEHESYSSASLPSEINFLRSARIGEKEKPVGDPPLYDFSRPVFAEKTEWYAYLMAMTEGA